MLPDAAALREATEEIGLPPDRVAVLGRLSDYETVTGFSVTPVVGWVEPPFTLMPDPVEVADVFEVPLSFVLDPATGAIIELYRAGDFLADRESDLAKERRPPRAEIGRRDHVAERLIQRLIHIRPPKNRHLSDV